MTQDVPSLLEHWLAHGLGHWLWLALLAANLGTLALIALVLSAAALLAYAAVRVGPRFVIARLSGLVLVLLGISFVTFLLGVLTPGTPVLDICGQHCTPDSIRTLEHFYHLDLPWYEQYGAYLNGLLHLDLGNSITHHGSSVWALIGSYVPVSAELGLLGLGLQLVIGVPWGVLAAVRAGSRFDSVSTAVALTMAAVPPFVTIPFYWFSMVALAQHGLPHLPIAGWGDPVDLIAPLVFFVPFSGYFMRLTRTTMLDVLDEDYVRAARAKGLPERVVLLRHGLRSALGPLLTATGLSVAYVVGGAVFIETFFNIPGIGWYAVQSIQNTDMPVVQGIILLVAAAITTMNTVIDVLYGVVDPRVKVH
jgi:ABC-type dipeptide/oligopeptide/nickel transport system permease component